MQRQVSGVCVCVNLEQIKKVWNLKRQQRFFLWWRAQKPYNPVIVTAAPLCITLQIFRQMQFPFFPILGTQNNSQKRRKECTHDYFLTMSFYIFLCVGKVPSHMLD